MQSLTRTLLAGLSLIAVRAAVLSEPAEIASVINATDLFKVKQVRDPVVSPDGSQIAYEVTAIERVRGDDWLYETNLWLAPVRGGGPAVALTTGEYGGEEPSWSPDGKRLAFVRQAGGRPQIFLLSVARPEELVQLTSLPTGALRPRWSPDGTAIAFTSYLEWDDIRRVDGQDTPAWPTERPMRAPNDVIEGPVPASAADGSLADLRSFLDSGERRGLARSTSRLDFTGEGEFEGTPSFGHCYVVEARPGATPRCLTPGYATFEDPQWLPAGNGIVCCGPAEPAANPDRNAARDLYMVGLDAVPRGRIHLDGYTLGAPRVSAAANAVAFLAQPLKDPLYAQVVVGVASLSLRLPPRILSQSLDRSAVDLAWSADGRAVYFSAQANGGRPLYRVQVTGAPSVERLGGFEGTTGPFDVGASVIALVRSKAANPSELFAADLDGKELRILSAHNSPWLDQKLLSNPERHTLTRPDGTKIDLWLLKPVNTDSGAKAPLVVEVHGGPQLMWGAGEPANWFELQYLAARGYAVVYCNPRGSLGYGRAFQAGTQKNWSPAPSSDVLAAADFAASQPWVDSSRQAIIGGSYGASLAAWIITHDHRFKAAVLRSGVYDLSLLVGEGRAWREVTDGFGGYPWESPTRALLDAQSPLTYVADCTTPSLLMQGDRDGRVGLAQGQEFYRALKILRRPAEYVLYPGGLHEMVQTGNPSQRLDELIRADEFIRRYLADQ